MHRPGYGAWYPTRQIVVHKFEKPAYYEVEFSRNSETSRAIFSRYGQWFETRTKISSLPDTVVSALRESEFGDWIWSDHKERIEAIGAPELFYRLQVSNRKVYGKKRVILLDKFIDKFETMSADESDAWMKSVLCLIKNPNIRSNWS